MIRELLVANDRIGIADVKAMALKAQSPEIMMEVVTLALKAPDSKVAWNAVWIMTHFSDVMIMSLSDRKDEFIDMAMNTENVSVRRLFLNIIERLPMKEEDIRTDFLDFCLEHMLSVSEPPGIQSLCMKLAYIQCGFYPELLNEFYSRLEIMEEGYSKAIVGLRRRLMKLRKNNSD